MADRQLVSHTSSKGLADTLACTCSSAAAVRNLHLHV